MQKEITRLNEFKASKTVEEKVLKHKQKKVEKKLMILNEKEDKIEVEKSQMARSKLKLNNKQEDSNNNAGKAPIDRKVDKTSSNNLHGTEPFDDRPASTPDPKGAISKTESTENIFELNTEEFGNLLNNMIEDYNMRKNSE